MGYCPQCGAPLAAGARYCGNCGSAPGSAAPAGPAAGVQGPGGPDTGLAETLLLVGAALSLVLPLLLFLLFAFLGAAFAAFLPLGAIPAAALGLIALVFLAVGLLWAWVAWYARGLVQRGERERGGVIAMVAGVLMLVTGSLVSGLFVLGGGVLAYTAR